MREPLPLLLLAALLLPAAAALAQPAGEYEVKAAFIHNIAKFVQWPDRNDVEGPQRLCLLGQDGAAAIAATLRGKAIGRGVWEPVALRARDDLQRCRVLFVAASETGNLRRILDLAGRGPVLTIADCEGCGAAGVMVNFYMERDRVRFEINPDAVGRAGLGISSQVLKLARIVHDGGAAP